MAFLKLNEITIKTSTKRMEEKHVIIGDQGRGFNGDFIETRQTRKEEWQLRTAVIPQEEGVALVGLLEGDGHNWTFDTDRISDGKGLEPSAGAAAGAITGGGVFGSYIALSAGDQITWDTAFGDPATNDYTILLHNDAAGTPERWAIKNVQGVVTKFLDGVSTGAASVFVSVDSSGNITIGDGAGAFDIDDLVFVPYAMPDSWLETGGGQDAPTRAWSNLPRLDAEGDLTNSKVVSTQGMNVVARARGFQNQDSATWERYGHIVSFDLLEV